MKITKRIALNELQLLFFSPIAWMILIIFALQSGLHLMSLFESWFKANGMGIMRSNFTYILYSDANGESFLNKVQEYLYLYIPLLTMGVMSRELSSGSIKLLYSSPVKNTQIILGKYLAMVVYSLILMVVVFSFIWWGSFNLKDFDWGLILSGMLGVFLLICTYASVGLFISSLTSYQVAAAMGTLVVLAALSYVRFIWQDIDFVRDITYWLSIRGRTYEFTEGLVCSEDVLYFLLVIALFLTLSILRLNAIRQKSDWKVAFSKYAVAVIAAALLGYASSRPMLMGFYDASATKRNTLTENSQHIVKELNGSLKMTTFINILDDFFEYGSPSMRIMDFNVFKRYVRFKPEMKMKYVYYYAMPEKSRVKSQNPGLSEKECVAKIAKVHNVDPDMFMSLTALKKKYPDVDLASEGYRMVRLLERGTGEKTFLRMFDGPNPYPLEEEISAALKRMLTRLPVVGFLQGHGERPLDKMSDRGYMRIAMEKVFRNSLINNGFDFEEVMLSKEIPDRINILVISDMRTGLSPQEDSLLSRYIAKGGNLFILGERNRQATMNPLLGKFGVQLLPGQLVQRWSGDTHLPDFIVSTATKEATAFSYLFSGAKDPNFGNLIPFKVAMPGATALSYQTDKGFNTTPVLVSSDSSWNEIETTDFIDEVPEVNTLMGEEKKAWPTALALSRRIVGKDQKIFISGDADCISNTEISVFRQDVRTFNFQMAIGVFQWMSDGEVPIDTRRPEYQDNKILASESGLKISRIMFVWVIPGLMLLLCLVVNMRRKRK